MSNILMFINSKDAITQRSFSLPLKDFFSKTRHLENSSDLESYKRLSNHLYKLDLLKTLKLNFLCKKDNIGSIINVFADISYVTNDDGKPVIYKGIGITSCKTLEEFRVHMLNTNHQRKDIYKCFLHSNLKQ